MLGFEALLALALGFVYIEFQTLDTLSGGGSGGARRSIFSLWMHKVMISWALRTRRDPLYSLVRVLEVL